MGLVNENLDGRNMMTLDNVGSKTQFFSYFIWKIEFGAEGISERFTVDWKWNDSNSIQMN